MSSCESLSEDITLKAREFAQRSKILRGRQIISMMIDYFKTKRSLQEQYMWQDTEASQWQADEKISMVFTRWTTNHHQLCRSLSVKLLFGILSSQRFAA
jgi:hypothetical protein